MRFLAAGLFVCYAACVSASVLLPEWARGGDAARGLQVDAPLRVTDAKEFAVPLDHGATSSPSFNVRYYIDDSHGNGKAGLPCFFLMGGEGPNNGIGEDYITQLAAKHQALLVSIEHRFYGNSLPSGGLKRENLPFLTSYQALQDAASLIDKVRADGYTCSKWIAFGGSYSGALSAWFRIKFSTRVHAALSSSGVVNAILDFVGFDEQVAEAVGDDCANDIRRTTEAFDNAINQGQLAMANKLLNARPGLPAGDLAYVLADSAAMADQYNNKAVMCQALNGLRRESDDMLVMQTFAKFTKSLWGNDFGASCFYDTACVANETARWQPTARSWWWQKCNEVAYFQNAPAQDSLRMARLNATYHRERCVAMFGPGTYPDTAATNAFYGGATPTNASRIFFSDFSDDPWQRASVTKTLSPDLPFMLAHCDGCGHCDDFHMPNPNDPKPLQAVRAAFESNLTSWLNQ